MRRAGLVVLACAASAGCFLGPARPTVPALVRSLAPPLPAEGIVVESVLLEQPAGDRFLDRELWDAALPAGAPETRALFAENGLRVGTVSGAGPPRFQTLLESDSDTVSPQLKTFRLRKEDVIATAGPVDPCAFSVLTDVAGKPGRVELKQARCGVLVRPEPTADGRVKLWCEPQLQHGDRREWFRPNEDVTRLTKHEEVPVVKFPALGFEATLGPDDCLLVGWRADQPGTLGAVLFGVEAQGRPRQRVLVVRTRQAAPPGPTDLPPITGGLKRPAVAAQAAARK
jgi:hypothetical protein